MPAPPTPHTTVSSAEEQLFLQAIGELAEGRSTASLVELERLYPGSEKAKLARNLGEAFIQLKLLNTQLQKEKSRCQQEKDRLARDFRQLQEDQEKLRKLVIEMEMRRR
jgi:hypothetical protein